MQFLRDIYKVTAAKPKIEWKKGDRAIVQLDDDEYWVATVTRVSRDGKQINFRYDDGDKDAIPTKSKKLLGLTERKKKFAKPISKKNLKRWFPKGIPNKTRGQVKPVKPRVPKEKKEVGDGKIAKLGPISDAIRRSGRGKTEPSAKKVKPFIVTLMKEKRGRPMRAFWTDIATGVGWNHTGTYAQFYTTNSKWQKFLYKENRRGRFMPTPIEIEELNELQRDKGTLYIRHGKRDTWSSTSGGRSEAVTIGKDGKISKYDWEKPADIPKFTSKPKKGEPYVVLLFPTTKRGGERYAWADDKFGDRFRKRKGLRKLWVTDQQFKEIMPAADPYGRFKVKAIPNLAETLFKAASRVAINDGDAIGKTEIDFYTFMSGKGSVGPRRSRTKTRIFDEPWDA